MQKQRWQWGAKKAIGLISKTTTLHMQNTFLYTSLPFLQDHKVKSPYAITCVGCKQMTTNFTFSL